MFQTLGILSGFLVVLLLIRFRASLLASFRALLMTSFFSLAAVIRALAFFCASSWVLGVAVVVLVFYDVD